MSILVRMKGFKMDEFKNVQIFETGTFCPFRSRISPTLEGHTVDILQKYHNTMNSRKKENIFFSTDFI